jgi:hypothetical protein
MCHPDIRGVDEPLTAEALRGLLTAALTAVGKPACVMLEHFHEFCLAEAAIPDLEALQQDSMGGRLFGPAGQVRWRRVPGGVARFLASAVFDEPCEALAALLPVEYDYQEPDPLEETGKRTVSLQSRKFGAYLLGTSRGDGTYVEARLGREQSYPLSLREKGRAAITGIEYLDTETDALLFERFTGVGPAEGGG